MKKILLLAAVAFGAISASAQAIEQPKFFDNWSIGVDGGVTTPMKGQAFFGSMRGVWGLHIQKQVTPAFAVGVEGRLTVNTSKWEMINTPSKTAFDDQYIGAYGAVNLFNLFGGYNGELRPFDIEAVAGAGWLHNYVNASAGKDMNDFGTKAGLNFNFNVNDNVTISVKPSVIWNMTGAAIAQTNAGYDIHKAAFNLEAGLTYRLGGYKFDIVNPYNQAEIDALNAQINDLRASLDQCAAKNNAYQTKINDLQNQLNDCLNRPVQTVKEVSNNLNSVRYVFFRIGSSVITADQQPNVEMIASYLKNHKEAKIVVKGYASQDGPIELNTKLAKDRAEAVKNALINKYKIAADRIIAEGEGIGHMFTEDSWNRVSICTIEDAEAAK